MLSDAQKKEIAHAAEALRASANALVQVFGEPYDGIVSTIVDARDTADKLDTMVNLPKSTEHVREVGSCSCDLDDTKPQGLTKQTKSRFGDGETEMA